MKFSIALPTRNRLEYLRYAVETIRRQDHDDWEIVISDNCSEDDIAGYVAGLADPRIRHFRVEHVVPVTENWNNALDRCTGDYVTMLGDDDGLMPGYFRRMRTLLEQFAQPDVVYSGAYLFTYANVMPEAPRSYFQPYGYAFFLQGVTQPYLMPREVAVQAVASALDFRVRYGFNMQFVTVRRGFIRSLEAHGPFYQSPFPDYYAMNVLFLKAPRIVVCPDPLVAIGVTPKSYGYYHNNRDEGAGMEFLNGSRQLDVPAHLQDRILPGSNINTSWLLAVEAIKQRYAADLPRDVSYRRYRMLQLVHVYVACYVDHSLPETALAATRARLSGLERWLWDPLLRALFGLARRGGPRWQRRIKRRIDRLMDQFSRWRAPAGIHGHRDLLEAFESLRPATGVGAH